MDEQVNQQPIAQAPLYSGNQAVPPSQPMPLRQNKKIFILIGALFLIVLLLISVLLFKKKPYVFTIDSETIPQPAVQEMYSYYSKQPNYDRQKALTTITSLWEEHHILLTAFHTAGLEDAVLNQKKEVIHSQTHTNTPDSVQSLAIENNALRQLLTEKLGVTQRSGDAFIITANNLTPDITATTEAVMQKELETSKTALDIGSSYDQVQNTFLQDQFINSNPNLTSRVFPFVNMTPDLPFLPTQDFVKTVFATAEGKTSAVFSTEYNGILYDGFVYITNATDGDINNYAKWLAEKEAKLQVNTDFSAIR